jgi:2,5-diamino-6-(ribosylamino)-4(3H)-pyrimidinone 5'-phosphate reductase
MRPYIICHMLSTIDGRIDGSSLKGILRGNDYETIHAKLKGDAWACGRTTMQMHFAEKKLFTSRSRTPAGTQPVFVARRAKSYAIVVDTMGKLRWSRNEISGDHLICVVSERASKEYLAYLRTKEISYIVAGKNSVDLAKAVRLLGRPFGIKRLLLEGGGHINGAFVESGLVDEISLLLVAAVDGRKDVPTVFDGISTRVNKAVQFKLTWVERRKNDILWLRYKSIKDR